MLLTPRARVVPLLAIALAAPLSAQQLIGYVNTRDASVTGASDVMDGHFVLTGSVGVTAKDHTAPITLSRGGTVNVCQTSVLHLTESREMTVAAPLLFSLDRGAVEIQMNAAASDSIIDAGPPVHRAEHRPARPAAARRPQRRHLRGESGSWRANARRLRPLRRVHVRGSRRAPCPLRTRQPARGGRPRDHAVRLPGREGHVRRRRLAERAGRCAGSEARTGCRSAAHHCCAAVGKAG